MAYMNKENATLIRNALKVAFPGIKFAVRKDTHSIHFKYGDSMYFMN